MCLQHGINPIPHTDHRGSPGEPGLSPGGGCCETYPLQEFSYAKKEQQQPHSETTSCPPHPPTQYRNHDGQRQRHNPHHCGRHLPARRSPLRHRVRLRPAHQHPPHHLGLSSWPSACILPDLQADAGGRALRAGGIQVCRKRDLRAHRLPAARGTAAPARVPGIGAAGVRLGRLNASVSLPHPPIHMLSRIAIHTLMYGPSPSHHPLD